MSAPQKGPSVAFSMFLGAVVTFALLIVLFLVSVASNMSDNPSPVPSGWDQLQAERERRELVRKIEQARERARENR